jgi:hypothetical protein
MKPVWTSETITVIQKKCAKKLGYLFVLPETEGSYCFRKYTD